MEIVAVVQAEVGKGRFHGLVLEDLDGEPVLARTVERVLKAETPDLVVVATSDGEEDDPVARLCGERGWRVHRGPGEDVLSRYFQVMVGFKADTILRISGNHPMSDPKVIDQVLATHYRHQPLDYSSNTLTRSYPKGLDVEVISGRALSRVWRDDALTRGDPTGYIRDHLSCFKTRNVAHTRDLSWVDWEVKTPRGLELARRIYHAMDDREDFHWLDAVELMPRCNQWWRAA